MDATTEDQTPDPTALDVEHGDASVPDSDDAADVDDLLPEDPPTDAPATGDPNKKPAVAAPVPAHGEMASQEQLDEGDEAVERAGGGGTDTAGIPTGEADTGRPGQGGSGQGTDDDTVGTPEQTADAATESRR
jgi:hypothetical protein